jgi:hypothetical protein
MGSFLITPAHNEAQPRSPRSAVVTPIIVNACSQRSRTETAAQTSFPVNKAHATAKVSIFRLVIACILLSPAFCYALLRDKVTATLLPLVSPSKAFDAVPFIKQSTGILLTFAHGYYLS